MSTAATAAKPSAAQTPLIKRQFGSISVAVFGRKVTKADGTTFTAKDYVLQKSWKDKSGDWQNQSLSLQARDILAVTQALTQAFVDTHEHDDEQE